jgi:hypothetical protein
MVGFNAAGSRTGRKSLGSCDATVNFLKYFF